MVLIMLMSTPAEEDRSMFIVRGIYAPKGSVRFSEKIMSAKLGLDVEI